MVRLMQRFGLAVSDALMARAVLAFADREIGRRRQPLCAYVKKLGACPHLKFCSARHIVLQVGLVLPVFQLPWFRSLADIIVSCNDGIGPCDRSWTLRRWALR